MGLFGRDQIMGGRQTTEAAVLYSDDFNRADAANLATGSSIPWVNAGDAFQIVSNRAAQPAGTSGGWATINATYSANQWCELDITLSPDTGWAGLVVRYTDQNNFYLLRYAGTPQAPKQWQLYKRKTSTYTLLASLTEAAPSVPFRIRLEVDATSVRGYHVVAGVPTLKCTGTLDGALTGADFGIFGQGFGSGMHCDNFEGDEL